jgi:raffinose/stachyose/melibiose transport system permease protein
VSPALELPPEPPASAHSERGSRPEQAWSRRTPARHRGSLGAWLVRRDRQGLTTLHRAGIYLVLVAFSLIFVVPLLITVFASFKTLPEVAEQFPLQPPSHLNFANYLAVFRRGDLPRGLLNSVILVLVSVAVSTFLTSTLAYCLSRFEFRLKRAYFFLLMTGMLLPTVVTEVARFGVIKWLGVYNTMLAPVLIYAATETMMQVYIYLQFMEKIPLALDESARIDGASYAGVYFRIIFPLTLPATATLAIIKMIDIMNDMFIPFLYMPSPRLHTLTTALMAISGDRENMWTLTSAAVILVMLPTFLLYLILNRWVFKGIVAGAVRE